MEISIVETVVLLRFLTGSLTVEELLHMMGSYLSWSPSKSIFLIQSFLDRLAKKPASITQAEKKMFVNSYGILPFLFIEL